MAGRRSPTQDWVLTQGLQDRTKQLALRVIRMLDKLPRTEAARTIGRQLLRSATSIAANYRAACRARSKAEFSAKLGIVVEEADETVFWLELLADSTIAQARCESDGGSESDPLHHGSVAPDRPRTVGRATPCARNQQINKSTNQQIARLNAYAC